MRTWWELYDILAQAVKVAPEAYALQIANGFVPPEETAKLPLQLWFLWCVMDCWNQKWGTLEDEYYLDSDKFKEYTRFLDEHGFAKSIEDLWEDLQKEGEEEE
jgi:hypothetical protein